MSNELQQQISTMLTQGSEFVMSQAPDVIRQVLLYAIIQNVALVLISAIVIWLSYAATFVWSEQTPDYYDDWSTQKLIFAISGGIASVVFAIVGITSAITLLQILIVPKAYLLSLIVHI